MSFVSFDAPRLAKALSDAIETRVAGSSVHPGSDGVSADVFFERSWKVTTTGPSRGAHLQQIDEGLAVRLRVGERSWSASEDALHRDALERALRSVERFSPSPRRELGAVAVEPWAPPTESGKGDFGARLERAVLNHRAAFELQWKLTEIRRQTVVAGPSFVTDEQNEHFFSLEVRGPFVRYGTLLGTLEDVAVERVAHELVEGFRAARASAPEPATCHLVLAPAAAAVFLHETVAHTLEADCLAVTGLPPRAIGQPLGSEVLSVLDQPSAAPRGVRRTFDDEGCPVASRWLLRAGVIEQPLSDRRFSSKSGELLPGASRRASRHVEPGPRSTFLELVAGESEEAELRERGAGGIYVYGADGGWMDPMTGRFEVRFPGGRRIESAGRLGPRVGAFALRGRVADVLERVAAVGSQPTHAGAGWCSKSRQPLPVWARTPSVLLEAVEIAP